MKTENAPLNLERLEQNLEVQLHSELLPTVPLQVNCLLKEGMLVLVVQHPAPQITHPKRVFRFLKEILNEEVLLLGEQKVLVYLREMAQHQPYAFEAMMITENTEEASNLQLDFLDTVSIPELADLGNLELDPYLTQDIPANLELEPEAIANDNIPLELEPDFTTQEENSKPWEKEVFSGFEEVEDNETKPFLEKPVRPASQSSFPLLITGMGISAVMFFGTFYALTRPCVIGECNAIAQAEELAQGSADILTQPLSGQGILSAQEQLNESLQVLGSIPPWSSHRAQAQQILGTYENRAESLDQIVSGLQTAARAGYASQNPPLTPQEWEKSQQLWREAITRLEFIPPKNEFYSFAQEKLPTYQSSLAIINRRLDEEQKAQISLKAAQEVAETATSREKEAISLSNWESAQQTWEIAVNRLQEIPAGTTAYVEAQTLLEDYSTNLNIARDHVTRENFAADIYNSSIRTAQLAKASESRNQWSEAVLLWRNALAYIEQVPRNTYVAGNALSLVSPYQQALTVAESQLKSTISRQQAQGDLEQTCSGSRSICEYSFTDRGIRINLSPIYMREVTQTAMNAEMNNDNVSKANLYNHILNLEESLRAISRNTRLPVEIYTPDGALVDTYARS